MEQQGKVPSVQFYRNGLQVCMKNRALAEAKWVHRHLAKNGLESDRILGGFVVTTPVNCGSLSDGLYLFRKLLHRSVFSWTAIISGHSNAGNCRVALACYERMLKEGVQPNKHTFVGLLKACSRLEDLEEGKRIHAATVTHGLESDVFVGSTLISMYAKCGSLEDARHVFDGMSYRNAVSWNAMLAAYSQNGQGEMGLQIYKRMCTEGVKPDARTFVSAFQACGALAERERTSLEAHKVKVQALQTGKAIHYDAAQRGFESDVFAGNTLVSMYAKCGSIMDVQHVFDRLSHRDVVSRNALIAAYAQQGEGQIGLQMFWKMQQENILPDAWMFVSTIQACGTLAVREDTSLVEGCNVKLESLHMVKRIHAEAVGRGFESNVFGGTNLVSMYTNCGRTREAIQRQPSGDKLTDSCIHQMWEHGGCSTCL